MHNRKYRTTILLSSFAILASVAAMAGASYALFTDKNDDLVHVNVSNAKINVWTTSFVMAASTNNGATPVSPSRDGTYRFKNGGTAKVTNENVVFTSAAAGDSMTIRVRVMNASPVKIQWKLVADNAIANASVTVYDAITQYHDVTGRLYYSGADAVASGSTSVTLADYYVVVKATGSASGTLSFNTNAVFANSIERKVSSVESWENAITALQGMENQCYTLTDDIVLGTKGGTDQNAGKELFFTPAEGKETFVVINGNGHTITLEGDPTGEVGKGDGKINSSGFGFHPRKAAMTGINNDNTAHAIGKTRIVLRNVTIVNDKTTKNMTNTDDLSVYTGEHAYFDADVLDATGTTFDGGLMVLGNSYFTYSTFQYSDGLGDPTFRYLCLNWGDVTGAATCTFFTSTFTGRLIDTDKKLAGMLYIHGDTDTPSYLNLRAYNRFTGATNVSAPSNDVVIGKNTILTTDKSNVFEDGTKVVNGVSCVDVDGSSYNGETWKAANVMKNLENIQA